MPVCVSLPCLSKFQLDILRPIYYIYTYIYIYIYLYIDFTGSAILTESRTSSVSWHANVNMEQHRSTFHVASFQHRLFQEEQNWDPPRLDFSSFRMFQAKQLVRTEVSVIVLLLLGIDCTFCRTVSLIHKYRWHRSRNNLKPSCLRMGMSCCIPVNKWTNHKFLYLKLS